MIYRETIVVENKTAAFINNALTVEPICEDDCFGEDEKISFTATFSNGFQADVECIGVQYEEGGCNTAWTQAVLFNPDGGEENSTPPDSSFFDEWWLTDNDGNEYCINVVIENDFSDDAASTVLEKNTNRAEKRRSRRKAISRKEKLIKAKFAGSPDMTVRERGKLAKGKPFPWATKERRSDRLMLSGRKYAYKKSVLRKLDKIEYGLTDYEDSDLYEEAV